MGLITDFDLITQFREVSIEHYNGCGQQTEDVYYSGHLVLSHLGLAFVLMLIPFSPELVLFSDFEFRTSLETSILLFKIFLTCVLLITLLLRWVGGLGSRKLV